MKKRLLALALCLVMMTSLLPITAAAATVDRIVITGTGFGSTPSADWGLQKDNCNVTVDGIENATGFIGHYSCLYKDRECTKVVQNDPVDGETYYFQYGITASDDTISFTQISKDNYVLEVPGYSSAYVESKFYGETRSIDITFQVTKDHDWKFTVSKNNDTLTAQCNNQGCPTKKISVTLKADSVTLPTSPFNARLVGWDAFQAATGAENGDIVYKCNGEPADKNNPKAGQYQAWVMIKNLRGPVYQDGVAAFADNQDSSGNTAELFVQYTAVDPKVTAQTGDNRPIELMLGSVVVFSALAAAAFIVDSKRRLQQ